MKVASKDFYTELAPFYGEYTRNRADYFAAIDRFIINRLRGDSILDIGAGDGVRSARIAAISGISKLTLVEPNAAMAELCRKNTGWEVLETSAEDLVGVEGSYDNVLCLYNVLGHVGDSRLRVEALEGMGGRLNRGGSIYLDVNNRHNMAAYGREIVQKNLMKEVGCLDYFHGDVSYEIDVGGKKIKASGHVFSVEEMNRLIDESNLFIKKSCFVNYDSGKMSMNRFGGQMFFELGRG